MARAGRVLGALGSPLNTEQPIDPSLYFISAFMLLLLMSLFVQHNSHNVNTGLWWWGGVLGAAAGEGVNTQLPGDRHSCQIISGRTIR